MSAIAPGIIVLERRPRWEAELKRNVSDPQVRIRGCRTAVDALELLSSMIGSVLVIDLEAGPGEALRLTETADRRALTAGILIIASAAEAELEWPFRELGAKDFLFESLRGNNLARLCLRPWQNASPESVRRS